jgi:CBS domain containing-hemolysin-like protein
LWVGIDQAESACMFHEAALSSVISAFFVVAEAALLDLNRYQFEIAAKRFMHDLTQNQFRSCAEFHLKEINKINELRRVAFSFS